MVFKMGKSVLDRWTGLERREKKTLQGQLGSKRSLFGGILSLSDIGFKKVQI